MPELGKDDKLLSRKQAARYLSDRGHAVSWGTLANFAKNNNAGKGPAFYRDGPRAVYSVVDLELWRRNRLRRVE